MSGSAEPSRPGREDWRGGFRISLRVWMILVGVIGAGFGLLYRREVLTSRNVASLVPVAQLEKSDIWEIAWSRDRERLAVVGWEKPVEVRDPVSLKLRETIGAGKKIIHFAFSPRGNVVSYSENDGSKSAIILDRDTGQATVVDAATDQPGVTFNQDGSFLATGGYGTRVRLWSVADGALLQEFDVGTTAGGLTAEFSPDGQRLAVGNRNAETVIFETATARPLQVLPKTCTQGLQFHPAGHTLAVAYVDGSLALWRVADGRLMQTRATSAEELYSVDWSPDGSLLATAGLKGKLTIWDPRDLTILREMDAPHWVIRVRFSPDGLNLHYAGGDQGITAARHLGVFWCRRVALLAPQSPAALIPTHHPRSPLGGSIPDPGGRSVIAVIGARDPARGLV